MERKAVYKVNRLPSTEHLEQVAVIGWARAHEYQWPELRWLFAVPNGAKLPYHKDARGHRYSRQAEILLEEGLLPGVSDLVLPCARGPYHALFIELKYGRNTLTEEQAAFLEAMLAAGYMARAEWGADAAIGALEEYLRLPAWYGDLANQLPKV
jgi:hypothetical protein